MNFSHIEYIWRHLFIKLVKIFSIMQKYIISTNKTNHIIDTKFIVDFVKFVFFGIFRCKFKFFQQHRQKHQHSTFQNLFNIIMKWNNEIIKFIQIFHLIQQYRKSMKRESSYLNAKKRKKLLFFFVFNSEFFVVFNDYDISMRVIDYNKIKNARDFF